MYENWNVKKLKIGRFEKQKQKCLNTKNWNVLKLKTKMSKYKKFKTKCLNTENWNV
jgi:hypothetical protein